MRRPQHGLQKICTVIAVDPARPQYDELPARLSNPLFSFELRCTVYISRTGRILFCIWRRLHSVEDIIRRVVHQSCPQRRCFARHCCGCGGIHGKAAIPIAFRLVHRRIRGRVHDYVGPHASHQPTHAFRIGQIALSSRRYGKFVRQYLAALQGTTHLAIAAKEK